MPISNQNPDTPDLLWLTPNGSCVDDLAEAIEYYANDWDGPIQPGETLRLEAFTHPKKQLDADDVLKRSSHLDWMLEQIDEDYGGEEPTTPTDAMIAAERAFAEAVVADYKVFRCEPVPEHDRDIDLHAWCSANYPDALETD